MPHGRGMAAGHARQPLHRGREPEDPARLHVMPLSADPPAARADELRAAIKGRETVELKGATLYAVYPDGMGESKLTLALIERKLGVKTSRPQLEHHPEDRGPVRGLNRALTCVPPPRPA